MKKPKIKPLPVAKEFADYFVSRAKREMGIKTSEYRSISMDYWLSSGHVWVWFFEKETGNILARVEFDHDGHVTTKKDNREELRKLAAERGDKQ